MRRPDMVPQMIIDVAILARDIETVMKAPALLPPRSYLPIVLPMSRRIRDASFADE